MKIILIIALLLAGGSAGLIVYQNANDDSISYTEPNTSQSQAQQQKQISKENCVSDECLQIEDLEYPASELPEAIVESLNAALDDEYKAFSTYEAVIAELGSTKPFSMIIRAEESHIASLKSLFDKYGLPIPENPYLDSVEVEESRSANCQVGVDAEIANAGLYRETLLPAVAGYSDITQVFTNLMNASQDKHLPAFEKCAS